MRTDKPGVSVSSFDEEDSNDAAYREGDAWATADDDIFASDAARSAIRDADDDLHEARQGNRR